MPAIRGLTTEQQTRRNDDVKCRQIRNILRTYMDTTSITTMAELIHEQSQSLTRKFNGRTKWDVATLSKMCSVLGVSAEDKAKMLDWKW